MSESIESSKPRLDCSRPAAAMMAPPGTPGAAIIMMPSRRMKPKISLPETSRLAMYTMDSV